MRPFARNYRKIDETILDYLQVEDDALKSTACVLSVGFMVLLVKDEHAEKMKIDLNEYHKVQPNVFS
jgi:hypothetical protein